jgi:endonuclease/exonuclease/phosphatase family metal-dependent hydrolase
MTWNLQAAHGGEELGTVPASERDANVHQLERAIASYDPDVVMLQEVENGYERNGKSNQWDMLRTDDRLGATDGVYGDDTLGSGILTRNGFTIDDNADGRNRTAHQSLSIEGEAFAAPVRAPKREGGSRFTAVSTHQRGDELPGFRDDLLQDIHDGKAVDPELGQNGPTGKLPRRLIVAGDFNEHTTTVEDALAPVGLQDVQTRMGLSTDDPRRLSFPDTDGTSAFESVTGALGLSDELPRDIDHILVDGDTKVRSAEVRVPRFDNDGVVGAELSDHRPMIADVQLSAPARQARAARH